MKNENKEENKQLQKSFTYQDLIKFENPEIYSTFGKQRTSDKISAPKFGFGTSDRKKQAKIYTSKAMAKTDFWGKDTPGPAYDIRGTEQFSYKKGEDWKIGTEPRNTLNTGPKYDYYLRRDVDFQPDDADKTRRPKLPDVKIGLEDRFCNDPKRNKGTPGPQYNPSLKHEIPNTEKFSFGFRRQVKGFDLLITTASTPQIVGPGSYIETNPKTNVLSVPKTSVIEQLPHYSIGRGPQLGKLHTGFDQNQTHDTKQRACGPQHNSKKKTLPSFSFGKSKRDYQTGTFKDMMATQPTKICINHPKY